MSELGCEEETQKKVKVKKPTSNSIGGLLLSVLVVTLIVIELPLWRLLAAEVAGDVGEWMAYLDELDGFELVDEFVDVVDESDKFDVFGKLAPDAAAVAVVAAVVAATG